MLDFITNFFKLPCTFDDLRTSEKRAYLFVAIVFGLTSLFILAVVVQVFFKDKELLARPLGLILSLNFITFFIFAKLSRDLSVRTHLLKEYRDLLVVKKRFYFSFLSLVGFPYMLLATWVLKAGDLESFWKMSFLFLSSLTIMIFFDYKILRKFS